MPWRPRGTRSFGTVESKLKGALAEACAQLKLLTKLGINDILTRQDFAEYRTVLCIGQEFASSDVDSTTQPRTRTPKAPRQASSLTTMEAILRSVVRTIHRWDIPSITAKVASLKGELSYSAVSQGLVKLKKQGKIVSLERGNVFQGMGSQRASRFRPFNPIRRGGNGIGPCAHIFGLLLIHLANQRQSLPFTSPSSPRTASCAALSAQTDQLLEDRVCLNKCHLGLPGHSINLCFVRPVHYRHPPSSPVPPSGSPTAGRGGTSLPFPVRLHLGDRAKRLRRKRSQVVVPAPFDILRIQIRRPKHCISSLHQARPDEGGRRIGPQQQGSRPHLLAGELAQLQLVLGELLSAFQQPVENP